MLAIVVISVVYGFVAMIVSVVTSKGVRDFYHTKLTVPIVPAVFGLAYVVFWKTGTLETRVAVLVGFIAMFVMYDIAVYLLSPQKVK
jgi:hypothetical protein